ncbi:MAG: Rieske 2Fe-2S domain-containing protein [Rhodospirillaceae bacterium]|nr:Rieske 2Fe-2S domain-containing protein [Rhodospirillaceae bacterium]
MMSDQGVIWPKDDFSRVPYRVFADQSVFDREQERIFNGPVWCYLGLEAEIAKPGDFKTTFVGNTSVVVNRAKDGSLHAFENRCAHRGATIVREPFGNSADHTCIYHHWCYSQQGDLLGVPFQRGLDGKGGMPKSFNKKEHGLRRLKVASYRGVVFGSFHADVPPLEVYLGKAMLDILDTLFQKPVEVIGYMRQRMPSNWKLYWENAIDCYHAGLLHQFGTTFGLFRATQDGGSILGEQSGLSFCYSIFGSDDANVASGYEGIEAFNADMKLNDPSILEYVDEDGDGRGLIIMAIFPSVVFQRISNTLATRQIRPKRPGEFELYWTCFGYADEDPALRALRIKQNNLIGPAGLVSMEDGESGVLIQRAIERRRDAHSVIEMGGTGPIVDQDHLITEVSVRGFWQQYCDVMGYEPRRGDAA